MWINSIQRANLTNAWILRKTVFDNFIAKFTVLQMLHGCRTDLIIKCLVYSKKDRNFFLFLQTTVLINIGVLYREQFQKETWN
jgi:hypothetical protein